MSGWAVAGKIGGSRLKDVGSIRFQVIFDGGIKSQLTQFILFEVGRSTVLLGLVRVRWISTGGTRHAQINLLRRSA